MSSSGDDSATEYMSVGSNIDMEFDDGPPDPAASRAERRRRNHDMPSFDISKMCLLKNFERPYPTKEDNVVYMRKGKIKLGYVVKVVRKYMKHPKYKDTSGVFLNLEQLPNMAVLDRLGEEAMVVERGFSLGESVIRYQNAHKGDAVREKSRTPAHGIIGQVVGCRLVADVLLLPAKTSVARDVPLDSFKPIEILNFNSTHNYVMYGDWIGDMHDIVNDITLVYKQNLRLVVRESNRQGVMLQRKDRTDDNKAFVPGECVYITLADALGRYAKWDGDPPAILRRRLARHSRQDRLMCIVEKVVPSSVRVHWLTSPTSVVPPSEKLDKDEIKELKLLDTSANQRISAADRIVINTDKQINMMPKKAYFKDLHDNYSKYFDVKPSQPKPKRARRGVGSSTGTEKKQKEREEESESAGRETEGEDAEEDGKEAVHMEHADEEKSKQESSAPTSGGDLTAPKQPSTPNSARTSAISGRLKRVRKNAVPRRATRRDATRHDSAAATPRPPRNTITGEFIGEVIFPHSYVDVEWMDGTISKDIPGYALIPVDPDLDQQDHLPGNLVARKGNKDHDSEYGLLLRTNPEDRIADVRWFSVDLSRSNDGHVLKGDEKCTLFEIMLHPTYRRHVIGNICVTTSRESASLKDVCFQITRNLDNGKQEVQFYNGETAELWPTEIQPVFASDAFDGPPMSDEEDDDFSFDSMTESGLNGTIVHPLEESSSEAAEDQSKLRHALQVLAKHASELNTGEKGEQMIHYRAARALGLKLEAFDEMSEILACPAHRLDGAIAFVRKIDEAIAEGVLEMNNSNEWTREKFERTISELKSHGGKTNEKRATYLQAILDAMEEDAWLERVSKTRFDPPMICIPLKEQVEEMMKSLQNDEGPSSSGMAIEAALGTISNVSEELGKYLAKIRGNWTGASDSGEKKEEKTGEEKTEERKTEEEQEKEAVVEEAADERMEVESGEDEGPPPEERINGKESEKGTFISLEKCPPGHHFYSHQDGATNQKRTKAIMKEHRLLAKHLPTGIHVWVFEDRIDVMSVLIVGPRHTPFELTPFHFELRLPSIYPEKPPEVHYVAHSEEQLNPNLYQTGKVCTSLLGTWAGQGIEKWTSNSNLMQVFLSIQALILNSEPYFNEAGYENRKGTPEAVPNSKRYNETVTINSLEYMWKMYNDPPQPFQDVARKIIKDGFDEYHARVVEWTEGRMAPLYPINNSAGFKLALSKSIARVAAAIEKHPLKKVEPMEVEQEEEDAGAPSTSKD